MRALPVVVGAKACVTGRGMTQGTPIADARRSEMGVSNSLLTALEKERR